MASLTAHLTTSGDHGRLGFHPSCPACRRQRLFGSLASDPVISRRAQAALASGVLALSAAGPSAALAQEPDQQVDNAAGGDQAPSDDDTGSTGSANKPAAGPGVAPTPSPEDSADPGLQEGDAVEAPGTPDGSKPGEDPLAPPADPPAPDTTPGPVSPGPPAAPPPPLDDSAAVATPSEPSSDETPVPPDDLSPPRERSADTQPREHSAREAPFTPATPTAPTPAPPAAATPAPAVQTAPTSVASSPTRKAGAASKRANRSLVVEPGDSLWSIAKRVLGPDASAARIAREVDRLWRINSDQIGTGNPDLLLVGTRLKLR